MAAPKSSNYGGWFLDLENGTLDVYYGEGGASDPVEIARVDTSGMTVVTGDLNVSAGNISLAAGTLDIEQGGNYYGNFSSRSYDCDTHSDQYFGCSHRQYYCY